MLHWAFGRRLSTKFFVRLPARAIQLANNIFSFLLSTDFRLLFDSILDRHTSWLVCSLSVYISAKE
jgi:hypothetical protein